MDTTEKVVGQNAITKLISLVKSALGNKVEKVSGKELSSNDFTTVLKNKLDGIASGAEVNVQSDWNQTDSSKDDYIKNKPTSMPPTAHNHDDLYYTKAEVNAKNYLAAKKLTSSDDLNSLSPVYDGVQWYYWESGSRPANIPNTDARSLLEHIRRTGSREVQKVYINNENLYFHRSRMTSDTWSPWSTVYYEPTSTYSATGTRAVNGTAVASAIANKSNVGHQHAGGDITSKVGSATSADTATTSKALSLGYVSNSSTANEWVRIAFFRADAYQYRDYVAVFDVAYRILGGGENTKHGTLSWGIRANNTITSPLRAHCSIDTLTDFSGAVDFKCIGECYEQYVYCHLYAKFKRSTSTAYDRINYTLVNRNDVNVGDLQFVADNRSTTEPSSQVNKACSWVDDITGNAATATKATQDESGNNIKASYASSLGTSDNSVILKNKSGATLSSITVPYATNSLTSLNANNATQVNGWKVAVGAFPSSPEANTIYFVI